MYKILAKQSFFGKSLVNTIGLVCLSGTLLYSHGETKAASIVPAYQDILQINNISGNFFDNKPSRITQLAFGPDQRLYASTTNTGVLSFAYNKKTGLLSDRQTATNISGLGIGFDGNTMYLSANNRLVRLNDSNNNGLWGETGETNVNIVEGIPLGDHSANQIQIRNHTLYLGIGTRTIDGRNRLFGQDTFGETSYGGTISWIQDLTRVSDLHNAAQLQNETGQLLQDTDFFTASNPYSSTAIDKLIVHSSGARNPFGLALDRDGNLWFTNNYGRADSNGDGTSTPHPQDALDADFSNDVHDQLFKAVPKADYGYANDNWRNNPDALASGFFDANNLVRSTTFDNLYTNSYTLHDPQNPDGLGPSSSADGIAFYLGNSLPSQFQDKAFIARWNRGPITETDRENSLSYGDIVLVDPETGEVTQIADGFRNPLAILADSQGILIADYNGGIQRISAKGVNQPVPESPFGASLLLLILAMGWIFKQKSNQTNNYF
ncbi:sorbosone dehydrogenase family protein [Nostoc sp. FACHB-280]|uniref:PQQ-dependent sugar dehydrogenase n=1 Tax=Nostoc sp. FACHB-280 TaxID=2692839 RepID=UPI00168B205E|nr:hypothetical protein [Nostoc sp. FACHB-280]MBD2498232.1 hypothetical protein [Nostoc sp. FACHB-280]